MKFVRLLSLVFIFASYCGKTQTSEKIDLSLLQGEEREGEKNFQVFSYRKAIYHYKKAYQKDSSKLQVAYRLAQCYYFMRDFVDADFYASKVVNKKEYLTDIEIYSYFEILIVNKKYDEATYWYNQLKERKEVDPFYLKRMEGVLLFKDYREYSKSYQVEPLPFNSEESDLGLKYYKDTIIFLSNRAKANAIRNKVKDNGIDYYKLYYVVQSNDNEYSKVKKFGNNISNGYHVGPFALYDNNSKIIFTQSNRKEKLIFEDKVQKDAEGTVQLELYTATIEKRKFKDLSPFPYNNKEFSNAHPTVSEDGNTLIYSSNMPNGMGKSDLYICKKINDSWTPPFNLGEVINTAGSELFPYLNGNTLYFASDGHQGMGQLDIFKVLLVDNKPTKIVNLGYPVNSNSDDFGFVTKDGYSGYFSTNRGESINDQIYSFEAKKNTPLLKIIARDSLTKALIEPYSIKVNLLDTSNLSLLPVKTIGDSIFYFQIDTTSNYEVILEATGYINKYQFFNGEEASPLVVYMNRISVGQKVKLRNLYYDFDKATLRDSSRIELNNLVVWMEKNNAVSIKIISHTDNRGKSEYNKILSEKRAKTAYNYLIESGIDKGRLFYEGKGDTEPIVECPKPSDCSKEQHQTNRRTEFEIVSERKEALE